MQKLKQKITFLPEALLAVTTIWLRLANLGYSDYQGDEIKAFFLPNPGQSISDFLFTQRKGPMQFLVTYLLKLINPAYTNEFLLRLPFALAGMFAVFFFYKFVRLHFGRKVALFSSFFLSTNGFLIAFSRIVQYQSFVIFFMLLALYTFSLAVLTEKWKLKGLYLGFVFWAFSILSHYDGIFIAPIVLYLLWHWFKAHKNFKHIALSGVVFTVLLSIFYIPFMGAITDSTKSYWENRLIGGEGKISSSKYLFQVYQPIYTIHFYTILALLGGFVAFAKIAARLLFAKLKPLYQKIYKGVLKIVSLIRFWEGVPTEPTLAGDYLALIALFVWVLIPLLFLEVIVNIPGTHIFTYLIPLTVFIGFGTGFIYNTARFIFGKLTGNIISIVGLTLVFTFLFLQANAIFVGHTVEYPWEDEKFILWNFTKPSPIFHLSMFGFPYFRHWEEIGQFVKDTPREYYSTNERQSISRYHIPFLKDTDNAGYFVHIINPQSFTNDILSEKANYWAQKYSPVLTFLKDGKEIVRVYDMPVGTLEEIQLQGY